jgi:predicted Zn-dependent protease
LTRRWKIAAALVAATLTLPGVASALSLVRDAEIERTLGRMSAPIFQAAGLDPSSVEILLVNDRSLNAFVAGGRRVFLNTGLMMELETPEELLGVIAHETGHIAGGHEARRSINLRNAQGPALIGLLAGIAAGAAGGGPAAAAIAGGTQGLLGRTLLSHSRSEEASADQAALSYLERAGIDPVGLRGVLERFRGQEVLAVGNLDPYVLTHPLSTERMSLIERRVGELSGRSWPSDPDREYWHKRLRAKLTGFIKDPSRVIASLEGEPETEFTLYEKAIALHRLPDPAGIRARGRGGSGLPTGGKARSERAAAQGGARPGAPAVERSRGQCRGARRAAGGAPRGPGRRLRAPRSRHRL